MKAADFKKQIDAAARELERLSGELAALKAQNVALTGEINSAIDSDNYSQVEKLTAKQTELNNKIRAVELIVARKKETGAVSRAEIAKASNSEMLEMQKKIDKAQSAANEAYKDYLRKLLDVAALVNQAWNVRAEYLVLIPGITDPYSYSAETTGFESISHNIKWKRDPETDEIMTAINPDAPVIMNNATRDRFNPFAGRK